VELAGGDDDVGQELSVSDCSLPDERSSVRPSVCPSVIQYQQHAASNGVASLAFSRRIADGAVPFGRAIMTFGVGDVRHAA